MSKRAFVLLASVVVLLFLIAGCKGCKARKHKRNQNKALYTSQHFSDYVIESSFLEKEVTCDSAYQQCMDDILEFYERRNNRAAWFMDGTLTASAYDFLHKLHTYEIEFGDTNLSKGLDDVEIGELLYNGPPENRARLDIRLTATFFRYAEKSYGGTVDPKDLEWFIPSMKKDYQRLIDTLVTSPATYTEYEPVNDYYKALKKILVQYRGIEKKGGLPVITVSKYPLQSGDEVEAVALLKMSLTITGDYSNDDKGKLYTDTLTAAVGAFQHRVGLRATGRVDSLTLAEINKPITIRIRQIMLNMERLRWMPDSTPDNYLLINIPEYRLHVYEDHHVAWSMDVVVGNAATATSIFSGKLSVVGFSPYWRVPQSIIKKELLPKLKKDPSYFDKANLEAVKDDEVMDPSEIDWNKYTKGVPFTIRQKPGDDCALGLVAFYFPNSFDIYLHDTPAKSFFNENNRAFSHGCIRLSEPERLANYLFRNDSIRMPPDTISALMHRHIEKKVAVKPSVPVYIVYFTAWVDEYGKVNFRHDIYGHDAKLAKEIFGK
ncbi:MAG: murein L,D-transpeptidase [Bacteroidetes bacterium]|nr:murein L,D-transpeptidase [Bacteroidota bacterium]